MADTTRALPALIAPELSTDDGVVTTTSIQLAEHFGKRHNDVLRAIRNLLAEMPADRQRNFAHTVETRANPSGGAPISSPCYRITRDGFTLLAMGFTGKEALQWKLAYIDAFNRMEAELQKPAHDPERIRLAHALASEASAQVARTVFDAVMAGDAQLWRHSRYLLNLNYDRDSKPTVPWCGVLPFEALAITIDELPERLTGPDAVSATDVQLARLAAACSQRLERRAQQRAEKESTRPGAALFKCTEPGKLTRV